MVLGVLFGAINGLNIAYTAEVPKGTKLASKQVLIRNNGTEPQSLDPHKIEGVAESHLARDLFEGLIIINDNGEMEARVAESWQTEDQKYWQFKLKPNLVWSNGDPLTAYDFEYAWKRLADPATGSPYESYLQYGKFANIDEIIRGEQSVSELGVKALDDLTLEIILSEAVPYLPKLLAHTAMVPVPQKVIEANPNHWTQVGKFVGNGAYQLKQWQVNERIVLERNPHYWDNANTVIDEVTFLPISSEITEAQRYRAGEIDITASIPIEQFKKLKSEIPDEMKITPYLCTYYYGINNSRAPFTDRRVREALKLAYDQKLITNIVKAQGDQPAYSFTPPYIDGIRENGAALDVPEWFNMPMAERIAKAKALLKEAGYDEKNPLTIQFLYNTSDLHKKIAIASSSMLKQNLGVQFKLDNREWKTYADSRRVGDYDVVRASWCADYNEPTSFLNMMLSNSSVNTVHYKNAEFDEVLNSALDYSSEDARAVFYQEAEKILDRDSVIIPIFYYANLRLVKPHVGGYTGKNQLGYYYTKDLYIKD
ncbi:oligopeptide ABC transporter substrate-binding protein OppA [Wohlfahrtiimonas larvae]|uniref:Oligopeptide ABC transporter substrate-binding protein OppA n=1 Tax=Wohlfahrtiimonas larvae TaxID=1157986 RepID=A0ABP9MPS4_9GAMM